MCMVRMLHRQVKVQWYTAGVYICTICLLLFAINTFVIVIKIFQIVKNEIA